MLARCSGGIEQVFAMTNLDRMSGQTTPNHILQLNNYIYLIVSRFFAKARTLLTCGASFCACYLSVVFVLPAVGALLQTPGSVSSSPSFCPPCQRYTRPRWARLTWSPSYTRWYLEQTITQNVQWPYIRFNHRDPRTDFRRQNMTSVDVIFWRPRTVWITVFILVVDP